MSADRYEITDHEWGICIAESNGIVSEIGDTDGGEYLDDAVIGAIRQLRADLAAVTAERDALSAEVARLNRLIDALLSEKERDTLRAKLAEYENAPVVATVIRGHQVRAVCCKRDSCKPSQGALRMIINGVEYVLVPKVATDEMVCAGYAHRLVSTRDAINAAIAAAPPVPAVEVSDELAARVFERYCASVDECSVSPIVCGHDLIAAVQAELGPALGLVSREEMAVQVEAAFKEPILDEGYSDSIAHADWLESNARKRLEAREVMVGGK